ncbi:alpha-ketoglutarate-dependent 2,4-dichlorophenoxyacetate dioxygenase [Xylaria cf. heliscus]|nr:alpha-ketoglutarate-dependent 2,4-dichlorophenoxyacetate dioxygenase [Xylaria cf. heliscus]
MPGLIKEEEEPQFKTIEIKKLHPTFAAEVSGVNFDDVSEEQFSEILAAMAKYGVCVFRNTGLTDAAHVAFSRRFGELDNIKRYLANGRKPRYAHYELFDAGNVSLEPTGAVVDGKEELEPKPLDPASPRAHANRGNGLFHADSSFNPRRASFSLLRAARLPPPHTGGDTLFADSRTAAEDLDAEVLGMLLAGEGVGNGGLVGAHSMAHSRKLGSPAFFADLDPTALGPMTRHRVLQRHEPSGRMNLYVGAHLHHIEEAPASAEAGAVADGTERCEGKEIPDSWALVQRLNAHATQDKYVVAVRWRDVSDLVIWDNRAVLHRAGPGDFEGRYIRDLRRTTVHDDSPTAWGLNEPGTEFSAFLVSPQQQQPMTTTMMMKIGEADTGGGLEGRGVDVR